MPDTLDRFYSSRCATHTIFSNGPFISDARSGYGHAGPSPDAEEWRSDGSAEWDEAERTYDRRAGASQNRPACGRPAASEATGWVFRASSFNIKQVEKPRFELYFSAQSSS